MVFQWPPVLPKLSNLVQYDFLQKHPDLILPKILHYIERAPQNVRKGGASHMGWLSIKVTTQLKTSENSWEHRKTSKIIWYHRKNNWGPVIDNLVQFEDDFNTQTKKLRGGNGAGDDYLRPDQFLDQDGDKKHLHRCYKK